MGAGPKTSPHWAKRSSVSLAAFIAALRLQTVSPSEEECRCLWRSSKLSSRRHLHEGSPTFRPKRRVFASGVLPWQAAILPVRRIFDRTAGRCLPGPFSMTTRQSHELPSRAKRKVPVNNEDIGDESSKSKFWHCERQKNLGEAAPRNRYDAASGLRRARLSCL